VTKVPVVQFATASTNWYFGSQYVGSFWMDRLGSNASGGMGTSRAGQEEPSATSNNTEKFTGTSGAGLDYAGAYGGGDPNKTSP
jgi:hypothetical protein